MATQAQKYLTAQEYLTLERKAPFRSQDFRGETFAMSGGSCDHALIAHNISVECGLQLRARACELYASDMRVLVAETGLYASPDVVLVCSEPKFLDTAVDTLLNPTMIVEILSVSTREYDEIGESQRYQTIPSLKEYCLVDQYPPLVKVYSGASSGNWTRAQYRHLDDVVPVQSIACTPSMKEVYRKIQFCS